MSDAGRINDNLTLSENLPICVKFEKLQQQSVVFLTRTLPDLGIQNERGCVERHSKRDPGEIRDAGDRGAPTVSGGRANQQEDRDPEDEDFNHRKVWPLEREIQQAPSDIEPGIECPQEHQAVAVSRGGCVPPAPDAGHGHQRKQRGPGNWEGPVGRLKPGPLEACVPFTCGGEGAADGQGEKGQQKGKRPVRD